MKKTISLLLCACVFMGLVGCNAAPTGFTTPATPSLAPVATTSAPAEESTEVTPLNENITFWYCYTDKVQENNENLTAEFNETVGKELGITVTAEYQGDYATMSQKLKAAYVSGTAPAVTVLDTSMLRPYAASGILQTLDTYIDRDADEVNIADFQPAFMTDSAYDGQIYSLPYLRSTPILYLNTTILEQAGLDTTGPATWDDLALYAETIKEKTGKYGMTIFAYAWIFQAFMMEQESSIYNADMTATNINSDAAKEIINLINELRDNGSVRVLASSQSGTMLADVTSQNCGMWYYSAGGLTTFMALADANEFGMTTAFLPKGMVSACPTGGANLVMTSKLTDNQQEAAWQFIKWMTAKEQTIAASTTTGYLPSRLSAVEDATMQTLYASVPQFKTIVDQLEYAGGVTSSASEADAALVNALDSIWVNGADVDTTLAELEIKVNAILNQ